ncbi:MAG TPA: hypothetical protein VLJ68_12785 [Chitinophagaceae bacterium]|nr:hypothetical protein [Chitinophagaceae bacterium]
MEVHAHTHTARKKWTHYLWEFLMLFLAVLCGFLAENQREHMVEHQREKQYMVALLKDLEADTAHLKAGFPLKTERTRAIDSLFDYFSVHKNEPRIPRFVHNLMRRSSWDRNYDRNNITLSQLKNSGNMRLIRKLDVLDSILTYDFSWERADNYYKETYWSSSAVINDYIKKILNDYALLPYYKENESTAARLPENSTLTITIKPDLLLEYLNHLHKVKVTIRQDKEFYEDIEKEAERLISLIKKEYHLE